MAYKLYDVPFGNAGDKTPIPTAAQSDGSVSMATGYGPDYQRQLGVDPLAKDISRQSFNQALYDATSSIQALQAGQTLAFNAAFAAAIGGYAKSSLVARADGNGFWRSSTDANSSDPATGNPATWFPVGVTGSKTTVLAAADVTLADAAIPLLIFTGALTANVNIILPATWVGYVWSIDNRCTGAFTVTFKTAAGTGVIIDNGKASAITSDGTNIILSTAASVTATETVAGTAKIATQTLTNAGADDQTIVTPKKLAVASQLQAGTVFATAGTATAQTLAPVPAITSYVAYQRFNVSFNVNSGANPTINVSGLGAKSLKQYDASGAKIAAIFSAGQVGDIEYDGTDFVLLNSLPQKTGIQGASSNIVGSSPGTSGIATYTVGALCLKDLAGNQYTALAVSISPNIAVAGVDGLDTGTSAASTWYYVWAIWNGTTVSGLLSLSSTAPTMPAGYTHKARVGAVKTDSTANKYLWSFVQRDNLVQLAVKAGSNTATTPGLASGAVGDVQAPTFSAISLSAFVPATAKRVTLLLNNPYGSGSGTMMVAPNNQYGGIGSAANPVPLFFSTGSSDTDQSLMGSFVLETTNIYYASSNTAATLRLLGWEDSL